MSEPWIRVHANIAEKRVILRVSDTLGVSVNEAIGLLVRFWGAMSRMGNDGDVSALGDREIETWAGWRGKRGRFAEWVRTSHMDEEGRINEWDEYAGKLEERRAKDRERQQKRRDDRRMSRGRTADGQRDVTPESIPARANETIRDDTKQKPTLPRQEPEVDSVVQHYVAKHPTYRPGDGARKAIRKALGRGYSRDDICLAIDGNAEDDWCSRPDIRKHELSFVLREDKIDGFIAKGKPVRVVDDNGLFTPEYLARQRAS